MKIMRPLIFTTLLSLPTTSAAKDARLRIGLVLACILFLSQVALGQAESKPECPSAEVTGPAGLTSPGDLMTFTANVPAVDIQSLKYHWTVSAGTIIRGQGTPSIEIQTTREMSFTSVTATVEVDGLALGCPNSVSGSGGVAPVCVLPITIDEWGRLPLRYEAMRLITAGMEAKTRPDFHLLFLVRLGPMETRRSVDARVARIRRILESKTGLPKNKLHFIYSAWEQTYTRIYLVSQDTIDPLTQGNEATRNLEELRAIPKTPRRLSGSH